MKVVKIIIGLLVLANQISAQDTTYYAVIQQLFKIDELDQRYRNQIEFTETKYGSDSKEIKALYANMHAADSINLIQVEGILHKYGWLGYNKIGSQANTTLFMIIQHAELPTQEKYLPMMSAAVKEGNAKANSLALLEDRVALKQGKLQSYGSQLFWSKANNRYFIFPLEDPDNVDKRRAAVGLPPLSEYVKVLKIEWDVAKYKKELPIITAEWKAMLL